MLSESIRKWGFSPWSSYKHPDIPGKHPDIPGKHPRASTARLFMLHLPKMPSQSNPWTVQETLKNSWAWCERVDEPELPTSLCLAPPGASEVQESCLQTTTHANHSSTSVLHLQVTRNPLKHSRVTCFSSVGTEMPSPITPTHQEENLRFSLECNQCTEWGFIYYIKLITISKTNHTIWLYVHISH